jgi:UDP-N-acetylmuramyl tripeptide synthase
LPGTIAGKAAPALPGKLAAELPHGSVLVTGTNGKTSTTKLIAAALRGGGETVLTNDTGANLRSGVASALVSAADVRGRIDATIGVFEVDEASLRLVVPQLRPRHRRSG